MKAVTLVCALLWALVATVESFQTVKLVLEWPEWMSFSGVLDRGLWRLVEWATAAFFFVLFRRQG